MESTSHREYIEFGLADQGAGREHGLRGPAPHSGLPLGHWSAYIDVQEAVELETGILTEVDTYDWIAFLPMSDGGGLTTVILAG
jgi:hypothetical protein